MKIFTLSPSEFAFGFEGCKKCYFDKIVNDLKYQTFFPPVFGLLDICQKNYYNGKSSKTISDTLDDGTIIKGVGYSFATLAIIIIFLTYI